MTLAGRLPPARRAGLRALRDPDGELLDRALVLSFPGPDSVTGEDLVELHCHGGRAVVEAVERTLHATGDVRRAEPGEFTRRALLNGRIDLTEAAGLADLLEAETETQRRAALTAAEGKVSRTIRLWMDRLSQLSARLEVMIDYADDDEPANIASDDELVTEQQQLAAAIDAVLAAPPVERWREGIRVVVAGPPNAGKSTLVNLLGGRDAAIVSSIAGTTRDRIEVPVRRNGVAYVLVDTAGLHEGSSDPIERSGMMIAREAAAVADLMLWMGDEEPADLAGNVAWLHGRADLPERKVVPIGREAAVCSTDAASVENVWRIIEERSSGLLQGDRLPLHQREWQACRAALDAIRSVEADWLLRAEQLRQARGHLGRALGLDATEELLDALFSRFCLGK